MTKQGVKNLYTWLTASWPLVIKPGASEAFQVAKMAELYQTFSDYTDDQVASAFRDWTTENEKFPTTKNILDLIAWSLPQEPRHDTGELYFMERIDNDGNESAVSYNGKLMVTWDEFKQLPSNKDHLDPEEWARRYRIRRKQVLDSLRRSQ